MRLLALGTFLLMGLSPAGQAQTLPEYQPAAGISGSLVSIGSDTMEPLLTKWSADFGQYHPEVEFVIDARGSGTAPDPLIDGRSQLAPMSRSMTDGELAHFEARHGYLPTHFRVALDAIAVYVHPSNPLNAVTLDQLDQLFSAGRTCGGGGAITNWKQLVPGFSPQLRSGPKPRIHIVGRNNLSGTYEFFRKHALCGGVFRRDYSPQDDSNSVVWAVANDPSAIGYAGVGYRTPSVKMLALSRVAGGRPVGVKVTKQATDTTNIANGRYPLARFMYIYVDKKPGERLPPAIEEFLTYALSAAGQKVVQDRWFVPISERIAATQREKLAAAYERSWWQTD
jgi:phosphate transport system substrate-binding protein